MVSDCAIILALNTCIYKTDATNQCFRFKTLIIMIFLRGPVPDPPPICIECQEVLKRLKDKARVSVSSMFAPFMSSTTRMRIFNASGEDLKLTILDYFHFWLPFICLLLMALLIITYWLNMKMFCLFMGSLALLLIVSF